MCAVWPVWSPGRASWRDSSGRTRRKSRSTSDSRPQPGAKTAITLYKTLAVQNGLSLVECDLITGRTHQIRAQFAAAGRPPAGRR
ncbi:MAG: pseudouridine synthase [Oscillospiraceae bacterium]